MKVCPGCQKSTKVSERIEADAKKKGRHWLITFCSKCGYNYDLEEYAGEVLSPQQEMDRIQGPKNPPTGRYWPTI